MSSTFTGLLRTLKSTSSSRDSSLLSSCETELTELMHQIDVMVEKKRVEWEHQLHGMQIQCQQKEQEVVKLREMLEMRNKEIGQFEQRILGKEGKHKTMISQYEQQLGKLRSELDNLKKSYGKLERNSTKQSSDVDILREQLSAEREKAAQEIHQAKLTIEDWKDKVRELQTIHEVEEAKTKAMEQQRRSLLEKSQLMQEQLLSYQGQLNRKKQLMDNLEQKHVSTMAQLQNEILQYKDEIESQTDTIHDLKRSLENAKSVEEMNRRDRMLMKQENETLIHRFKQKEKDLHDLEQEIHALKRHAKKQDLELRNATDLSKIQISDESELVEKLKQSMKEYQREIRVKSVQEEVLLQKSKEQKQRLSELEQQYEDLRKEITRQVLSNGEVSKGNHSTQKQDFIRLQNLLHQKESEYKAEIAGMKNQVASLAQDLHHRDAALADISKRAARMEEELRDISSKYDKKDAELQVSNAQLQALRLENRHLRDSSMEEHLSTTADLRMFETHISEIENANARVIAQLEDENAYLKHEMEAVRDDKDRQATSTNSQSLNRSRNEALQSNPHDQSIYEGDTQERITSLQEQLDTTIKNYERTIQELDAENRSLKENASREQERPEANFSMNPNEWTHIDVEPPHNSTKKDDSKHDDEIEFTTVLDILGNESFSSGNNSRRVSFTKAFMMEEGEREKELEEVLEARIMDLEAKTNATMKKYQL